MDSTVVKAGVCVWCVCCVCVWVGGGAYVGRPYMKRDKIDAVHVIPVV